MADSIPLASFASGYNEEITAGASIALALLAAWLLDRALARRGRALTDAITRGELTPVARTRLRFVRRLASAMIIVIGVGVALVQFDALGRLAAGLLASGALAAAILGLAARQTLANSIAGIMLAITQPLRIGDWVEFEGEAGTVEDVKLNTTVLRTPSGQRVVIPNERIVAGVLRNDTSPGVEPAAVDASLWLPAWADVDRALGVLEAETGRAASVAEVTVEGVRVVATGDPVPPHQRGAAEAALLARGLRALRASGLLQDVGDAGRTPAQG